MSTWIWVLVVVVVVIVIALTIMAVLRNRRRELLRRRFGPEYDRAVRAGGDRRATERHLAELSHRRDDLTVHEASAADRERFEEQWSQLQARFVEEPAQAVDDADALVTAVLRTRGYPIENFDDRVAIIATDHPDVVQDYRAAQVARVGHAKGGPDDTEALRQALLRYHVMVRALLGTTPTPTTTPTTTPMVSSPDRPRAAETAGDLTAADEATADRTADDRTADDRTADDRTADDRTADDRAAEDPAAEEPAAERAGGDRIVPADIGPAEVAPADQPVPRGSDQRVT